MTNLDCVEKLQILTWTFDNWIGLSEEGKELFKKCEDALMLQYKFNELLTSWSADFIGYLNALAMPQDDYNGIIEYIHDICDQMRDCNDL